ncbi:exosortase system-associated protein, TIGR04073 family [Methylomagnum ishizawai]|uniref:exosortase system-associated protein, TIGR04073 family n=1 Tax=Methylomagnum ishizawai TaxID=1760988 RepID=UPI001C32A254|nr:exosortase system-associated protein, TIGR04073 family [Methylomagnum ishizawai]BBL75681.1 hypothetical protein MishRS11D_27790 [Methylomagnum ishizawai]
MKKINYMAVALVCVGLASVPPCHAQREPAPVYRGYTGTIAEKFGTGVTNMGLGWVEIPKTMYVSSMQDGVLSGLTLGLFKGMANTFGRMFLGMADMFTFMIPTKPMVTPDVVWRDFGTETAYSNSWELYNTR